MFNSSRIQEGPLAAEDGAIAATSLPLDESSSKIAFETATFGVG